MIGKGTGCSLGGYDVYRELNRSGALRPGLAGSGCTGNSTRPNRTASRRGLHSRRTSLPPGPTPLEDRPPIPTHAPAQQDTPPTPTGHPRQTTKTYRTPLVPPTLSPNPSKRVYHPRISTGVYALTSTLRAPPSPARHRTRQNAYGLPGFPPDGLRSWGLRPCDLAMVTGAGPYADSWHPKTR